MTKAKLLILVFASTLVSTFAVAKPKEDSWNLGIGMSFVNLNEETSHAELILLRGCKECNWR